MIQYSCMDLWDGFVSKNPTLIQAGLPMYLILGTGTAAKLVLYLYCKQFRGSDSIAALAEDHLNDVFSNCAAIVTATIAAHAHNYWWIDPIGETGLAVGKRLHPFRPRKNGGGLAGAILISLVILWRWVDITWQQVRQHVCKHISDGACHIQLITVRPSAGEEDCWIHSTSGIHTGSGDAGRCTQSPAACGLYQSLPFWGEYRAMQCCTIYFALFF